MLAGPAHAAEVVWLALSGQGGPYDETVEAVRADLRRNGAQVELVVRPWQELVRLEGRPPRMVVTIGVSALRGFVESGPRVPLLATLVPRTAYAKLANAAGQGGRAHSAVWLDQPAGRLFELLRLAMPLRRRVAVVFGPESRIQEEDVLRAASERNFIVVPAYSEGDERSWTALQSVIDNADVLLALPDPQVYNGETLYAVLTSTYRRGIPVVSFSQAFARAGALLALYSTPAQIGPQVGAIIRTTLNGRQLPPPQGPHDFSIGINAKVARSLGVLLDPAAAETWVEEIRGRERTR
jgi:putative ABC transport system substrate-binding protein